MNQCYVKWFQYLLLQYKLTNDDKSDGHFMDEILFNTLNALKRRTETRKRMQNRR